MVIRLLAPGGMVSAAVLTAVLGLPHPTFADGGATAVVGGVADENDGLDVRPAASGAGLKAPKVILISLDGAQPALISQYFNQGVLNPAVSA